MITVGRVAIGEPAAAPQTLHLWLSLHVKISDGFSMEFAHADLLAGQARGTIQDSRSHLRKTIIVTYKSIDRLRTCKASRVLLHSSVAITTINTRYNIQRRLPMRLLLHMDVVCTAALGCYWRQLFTIRNSGIAKECGCSPCVACIYRSAVTSCSCICRIALGGQL